MSAIRFRPYRHIGLFHLVVFTALWSLLFLAVPHLAAAQPTISEPDTKGDQLIFFYDARTDRVPFLSVTNPGGEPITVELAFHPQALDGRIADVVLALAGGGHAIVDPTTIAGGVVAGTAGLAVATPVVSDADRRPIVPPAPIVGGYTLANLQLGAAFGENPYGRFAVHGDGTRAEVGTVVSGGDVEYQRFDPNVLIIPSYYDPQTLSPPEEDGNRVILVAFADEYGDRFDVAPASAELDALFANSMGFLIAATTVSASGVLASDLQALAGTTVLDSSGKAFFAVPPGFSSNLFGLFSQSLGTFAAGQRMPAIDELPELPLAPTPTPAPAPTPGGGGEPTPIGPGGTPTPGTGATATPNPSTPTPGGGVTPTPNASTPTPGAGSTPTPGAPTPGGGLPTPTPGSQATPTPDVTPSPICGGCLDEATSLLGQLVGVVNDDVVPQSEGLVDAIEAIPLVNLIPGVPGLLTSLNNVAGTGSELVSLIEDYLASSAEDQCGMIEEIKGLSQTLLDQINEAEEDLDPVFDNPVLEPAEGPGQELLDTINEGAARPLLEAVLDAC